MFGTPVIRFLLCQTLVFSASFLGAQGSIRGLGPWYEQINKPSWNPPNLVFAPVWTVLFFLMGLSLFWIVQSDSDKKVGAYVAFGVQLVLNVAWSWLFFASRQLGPAFAEILMMWVAILATILLFARIQARAGWILVPYLAWVTFASVLNFVIWRLNA